MRMNRQLATAVLGLAMAIFAAGPALANGLEKRVTALEAENLARKNETAALRADISALKADVTSLKAENAAQQTQINELLLQMQVVSAVPPAKLSSAIVDPGVPTPIPGGTRFVVISEIQIGQSPNSNGGAVVTPDTSAANPALLAGVKFWWAGGAIQTANPRGTQFRAVFVSQ